MYYDQNMASSSYYYLHHLFSYRIKIIPFYYLLIYTGLLSSRLYRISLTFRAVIGKIITLISLNLAC